MREQKKNDTAVLHRNEMQNENILKTHNSLYSDEELVRQFNDGEKDAFRLIVERYEKKVRGIVYYTFNNHYIIDDVVQEVFLKVYQGLPKFRGEAKFSTWLYRIAVNQCRDVMRKERYKRIIPFARFDSKNEQDLLDTLTAEEDINGVDEIIKQALPKLPARFREIIILKEIEDYSYEEISEILQCEMGTVKSRLSRARSKLRDILEPYLKEEL